MRLTDSAMYLIHFLDGGPPCATTRSSATRHVTLWHAASASGLVDLHHDGVNDALKFLLLRFELVLLGKLVLVKPIQGVLHSLLDLLLVPCLELILELFFLQSIAHGEAIVFQAVLRFDLCPVRFVLCAVLFGFRHHS